MRPWNRVEQIETVNFDLNFRESLARRKLTKIKDVGISVWASVRTRVRVES